MAVRVHEVRSVSRAEDSSALSLCLSTGEGELELRVNLRPSSDRSRELKDPLLVRSEAVELRSGCSSGGVTVALEEEAPSDSGPPRLLAALSTAHPTPVAPRPAYVEVTRSRRDASLVAFATFISPTPFAGDHRAAQISLFDLTRPNELPKQRALYAALPFAVVADAAWTAVALPPIALGSAIVLLLYAPSELSELLGKL